MVAAASAVACFCRPHAMVRAGFVAPWLCFATLMACCVPGTLGWWRGGHMLTAQVAVTRLTPEALHACQLLLGETRHIEPHLLALPEASKVRRLPFAPLAAAVTLTLRAWAHRFASCTAAAECHHDRRSCLLARRHPSARLLRVRAVALHRHPVGSGRGRRQHHTSAGADDQ